MKMAATQFRLYSTTASGLPVVSRLTKKLPITNSDPAPPANDDNGSFSSSLYFAHLKSHTGTGSVLLHAEELGSTQTLVMETPEFDETVVCVAEKQIQGRGRGDNTWESPLGCLMFSFRSSFPSEHGRMLPFFQYLVSLAAIRACRSATQGYKDIHIKWPNDIYANRTLKIGGVLCQSTFRDGQFIVTTGVGLNVANELPTTCLSSLAKQVVRREVVLAEFFNQFDHLYREFLLAGPSFEGLVPEYTSVWLHSGQRVSVDSNESTVTITGISPQTAALLAVDDAGRVVELTPDGNRLDFFKGLVSRRM